MRDFSGIEILEFWKLFRAGKKKAFIIEAMGLSLEEANCICDLAHEIYAKGPRTNSGFVIIDDIDNSDDKKGKISRPPAKYSNRTQQEVINYYLNS